MSTAVDTPRGSPPPAITPAPARTLTPAPLAVPAGPSAAADRAEGEAFELHRWTRVLVIPFVLGAAFFAAAIGFGEELLMVPAFLFGPLLLIASLVYLQVSSDSNPET
jgi:hypothetical protein